MNEKDTRADEMDPAEWFKKVAEDNTLARNRFELAMALYMRGDDIKSIVEKTGYKEASIRGQASINGVKRAPGTTKRPRSAGAINPSDPGIKPLKASRRTVDRRRFIPVAPACALPAPAPETETSYLTVLNIEALSATIERLTNAVSELTEKVELLSQQKPGSPE